MSYQQLIIVGNVGRDAELRYTQNGDPVLGFTVAVNETWTDRKSNEKREKTTWFQVSLFGKQAESISQYVTKGKQVMVVGTVSGRIYTDNSGQPAFSMDVRARDVRLLGSRNGGGEYNEPSGAVESGDDIPF